MNCSDCKNTGKQICTVCCTYQGGVPDRWEPKPLTNYDRFVRKTLEEMAEFIEKLTKGLIVPPGCPKAGCKSEYCQKCWIDYLKQEADHV